MADIFCILHLVMSLFPQFICGSKIGMPVLHFRNLKTEKNIISPKLRAAISSQHKVASITSLL